MNNPSLLVFLSRGRLLLPFFFTCSLLSFAFNKKHCDVLHCIRQHPTNVPIGRLESHIMWEKAFLHFSYGFLNRPLNSTSGMYNWHLLLGFVSDYIGKSLDPKWSGKLMTSVWDFSTWKQTVVHEVPSSVILKCPLLHLSAQALLKPRLLGQRDGNLRLMTQADGCGH